MLVALMDRHGKLVLLTQVGDSDGKGDLLLPVLNDPEPGQLTCPHRAFYPSGLRVEIDPSRHGGISRAWEYVERQA